jgi:hypothetical protein
MLPPALPPLQPGKAWPPLATGLWSPPLLCRWGEIYTSKAAPAAPCTQGVLGRTSPAFRRSQHTSGRAHTQSACVYVCVVCVRVCARGVPRPWLSSSLHPAQTREGIQKRCCGVPPVGVHMADEEDGFDEGSGLLAGAAARVDAAPAMAQASAKAPRSKPVAVAPVPAAASRDTGVAAPALPPAPPPPPKLSARRLVQEAATEWRRLLAGGLCLLASTVCSLVTPTLFGNIIDALSSADSRDMRLAIVQRNCAVLVGA